tara:strand:+ start:4058 stop:4204 length:147 start_codon:yes stop_codon:yes gene_type:complete
MLRRGLAHENTGIWTCAFLWFCLLPIGLVAGQNRQLRVLGLILGLITS